MAAANIFILLIIFTDKINKSKRNNKNKNK